MHNFKVCCHQCYKEKFAQRCKQCSQAILDGKTVQYNGKIFHSNCFRYARCNDVINDEQFSIQNSKICCLQCYKNSFASCCVQCSEIILDGKSIIYNEKKYHPDCFRCQQCKKIIDESKFHVENGKPCCIQRYVRDFAPRCEQCLKTIDVGRSIISDQKTYHPDCFRCGQCDKILTDRKFDVENGKPCCRQCQNRLIIYQILIEIDVDDFQSKMFCTE